MKSRQLWPKKSQICSYNKRLGPIRLLACPCHRANKDVECQIYRGSECPHVLYRCILDSTEHCSIDITQKWRSMNLLKSLFSSTAFWFLIHFVAWITLENCTQATQLRLSWTDWQSFFLVKRNCINVKEFRNNLKQELFVLERSTNRFLILTAVEKEETVGGKETGEVEKIGPDWQTGSNIREAMNIAKKYTK